MHIDATMASYLHALEHADYSHMLSLFSENAIVNSPLYGKMDAKEFYRQFFADTAHSKMTLLSILKAEDPFVGACQFRHEWKLTDGTSASLERIDIFRFDEHSRISELTIIYDTAKIRGAFENMRHSRV